MTPTPLIWYKNQRVWRTMFTQLVTLITLAPVIILIVNDYFPSEFLFLAAGQAVAVQSVATKIMANEIVNAWLIKHTFLGSEPKIPQ